MEPLLSTISNRNVTAPALCKPRRYTAHLEDGSWGVEAEIGSYGAGNGMVDFVPEMASCFLPDRDYQPYSLAYTVSSDVLRLTSPTGLVLLDKFADDPTSLGPQGGAVATYGCVEDDGFYDGEVMPVN